ncbi:hypothetical protein FKM82_002957 [Ascaphus truei]
MAFYGVCSSRSNALTVRLDRQHKKFILHRLFYIAKISPEQTDRRDVAGYYDRLFHNMMKPYLGEAISGLLLVYPSCIIHVLESSNEVLYSVLKDLEQMLHQGMNALLQDAKIILISHNIPSRLFPQWYFRNVHLPMGHLEDTSQEQSVDILVEECLTKLLKLGVFLSKILKLGSKGPGEDLHGLAPELLNHEEIICLLSKSKELLTPEQFLQVYNSPLNVSMASDKVWPIPQHLYL